MNVAEVTPIVVAEPERVVVENDPMSYYWKDLTDNNWLKSKLVVPDDIWIGNNKASSRKFVVRLCAFDA